MILKYNQNEDGSMIARLEEEQQRLQAQLHEMERAWYLTPEERDERRSLQQRTLQKNEQLTRLRKTYG